MDQDNYTWLPVEEIVILQVKKLINAQAKQNTRTKRKIVYVNTIQKDHGGLKPLS